LATQESTSGYPFGLPSPFFMGNTVSTPDPIGGLLGLPVFPDEAISATLGGTAPSNGTQDQILCLRRSDLILFEGSFQTQVHREVLSGVLGARIQMHNYAAFIGNRYPSVIATLGGSGLVTQSGF
jgi:hypothetical protein